MFLEFTALVSVLTRQNFSLAFLEEPVLIIGYWSHPLVASLTGSRDEDGKNAEREHMCTRAA
jgi:hypothetical protein